MKVTSEQLEHCRMAVTIEVEEERVQQALRATVRRISRQRPIRGFRPGRAPVGVVLRRLGKEAVYDALVDDIGETLFEEALEESKAASGNVKDRLRSVKSCLSKFDT